MTFVAESRILPRALWRPAIFFFALAQITLAFAPLLEGHFGRSAYAHTEPAGTHLHYAHDESDCSACVARNLLSSAKPSVTPLALDSGSAAHAVQSVSVSFRSAATLVSHSRAPPANAA